MVVHTSISPARYVYHDHTHLQKLQAKEHTSDDLFWHRTLYQLDMATVNMLCGMHTTPSSTSTCPS